MAPKKRQAKAKAEPKAKGGDTSPSSELPASIASVNVQYMVQVQGWVEAIESNPILAQLKDAAPLAVADGGRMVLSSVAVSKPKNSGRGIPSPSHPMERSPF